MRLISNHWNFAESDTLASIRLLNPEAENDWQHTMAFEIIFVVLIMTGDYHISVRDYLFGCSDQTTFEENLR